MSVRVVSLIYFYLVSIIAIILLIIGLYNSVSYIINATQFEKYPLRYGGVERCEIPDMAPERPILNPESGASTSAEEIKTRRERCLATLEEERNQRRVEDMKNAVAFSLIGLVLFGIHFPIALRKSNEGK
jgi:hypothetical protein